MEWRVGVIVVLAAGVVSCGRGSSSPGGSPTVANVGGQPISQALFDAYVKEKSGVPPDQVSATLKASLLTDLEKLKAAAEAGEIRADPETVQEIELQRLELLAHSAAEASGVFTPPSEADLQAAYEQYKAGLPAQEFHVAHILVATEDAAKLLIIELQSGADFAKMAGAQSADDSKTRGGDLGWIAPGKLPVDFTNALQALKPGQITARPVHTIYGWHVIKLLESRPAGAPPFDQVKAQLAANLQQARYKQFLELALSNAKMAKGS
jgi:peptidyl-prolyl cis-trans isomerase C